MKNYIWINIPFRMVLRYLLPVLLFPFAGTVCAQDTLPVIRVNQVAFDSKAPKMAVIESGSEFPSSARFDLMDEDGKVIPGSALKGSDRLGYWYPLKYVYRAEFSHIDRPGSYRLRLKYSSHEVLSDPF